MNNLANMTRNELREQCRTHGIKRYSLMNNDQMRAAILNAVATAPVGELTVPHNNGEPVAQPQTRRLILVRVTPVRGDGSFYVTSPDGWAPTDWEKVLGEFDAPADAEVQLQSSGGDIVLRIAGVIVYESEPAAGRPRNNNNEEERELQRFAVSAGPVQNGYTRPTVRRLSDQVHIRDGMRPMFKRYAYERMQSGRTAKLGLLLERNGFAVLPSNGRKRAVPSHTRTEGRQERFKRRNGADATTRSIHIQMNH